MHIETLCTGDELLTGLTVDTNSRFFQEQLLDRAGEQVRRSTVVGDRKDDILQALGAAVARCEVLLVSGGLGPTADDLTSECAAEAAQVKLIEHPQVLRHIEERFRQRGVALLLNSRRQARVPEDAEVVLNAEGSAPLFIQRRGGCTLFFVPGVPREYRHLVEAHVVPRIIALLEARGGRRFSALRLLKTLGLPESHLDARAQPLFAKHPQVTFGFRTHAPENHLKLLAVAASPQAAQAALAAAEADARALLGAHVFGVDDDTLALVVGRRLRARAETLAVAESCTGGLISALLTEPAGASDYFLGGAVTYREATKTLWARVGPQLIAQHGVVSAEVARALAEGVRAATGATWALSVTGYAGPTGGDPSNPVGTVYLGLCGPRTTVERQVFAGDRARVRSFAAATALDLLRQALG